MKHKENRMTFEGRPRSGRAGQRGSALIGVFWLMAVLGLAVFTTTQLVHNDMEIVISQKQSFRAGQLAEMGIQIAMNPFIQKYDPLLYAEFEGAEGYEVQMRSEGGRLNINYLLLQNDRLTLETLFTFWGLTEDDASAVVDSLLDWVDEDDNIQLNGAEFEYYFELGYENYPFNRPFFDIEEMALVRGMDVVSEFKPDWRSFFTLWSAGRLNVNESGAELLEAMAETTPEAAEELILVRNGEDLLPGTEDDYEFTSVEEAATLLGVGSAEDVVLSRLSVNDPTIRVESTAFVADYQKTVVLVVRNRESQPVILSRQEIFYR